MAPKLYKMDDSPPARAVYLTAKALGIDLEYIECSLPDKEHLKPDFLKMNPQHTVPTLDDNGTIVWDSHAINVYLVTKYGKDDSLYPKDPVKRSVVDQRLHYDSGILFAHIRSIVRPMLYRGEKTFSDYLMDEVILSYEFLNTVLQEHKWLAGDSVTLADFSAITSVTSLECVIPINASKYPNLVAWIKRAQELPYYNVNQKGLEDFKVLMQNLMA